MEFRIRYKLTCTLCIHLSSSSYSAQSVRSAYSVRDPEREESSLEKTKEALGSPVDKGGACQRRERMVAIVQLVNEVKACALAIEVLSCLSYKTLKMYLPPVTILSLHSTMHSALFGC